MEIVQLKYGKEVSVDVQIPDVDVSIPEAPQAIQSEYGMATIRFGQASDPRLNVPAPSIAYVIGGPVAIPGTGSPILQSDVRADSFNCCGSYSNFTIEGGVVESAS